MVEIVKEKDSLRHDYYVKNLDDLLDRVSRAPRSLRGITCIRFKTKKIEECLEVIDNNGYNVICQLEVSEEVLYSLKLRRPDIVKNIKSKYDIIMLILNELNLYLDKDAVKILMMYLPNNYGEMYDKLNKLKIKYENRFISIDDIYDYLCIDKIVYPRQVFIAFMYFYRNRYALLKEAVNTFDRKLILNSFRKYVNTAIESKYEYYRNLGKKNIYSIIDDSRIVAMYNSLLGSNSIYQSLKKYEKEVLSIK